MKTFKAKEKMGKRSAFWLAFVVLIFNTTLLVAQDLATRTELEQILSRFTNYRFGTISIYRIKNIGDVRKALQLKEEKSAGITIDEALLRSVDENILNEIEQGVIGGDDITAVNQSIERKGLIPPPREVFEQIYRYYTQKHEGGGTQKIENAFLITTRAAHNEIPSTIIAMIVSYSQSPELEKSLKNASDRDIYTYDELKAFELDTSFSRDNLYDLMMNTLIQRNVENKTVEAQGLGNPNWFAPKVFGLTKSVFFNESDISSFDVQMMLRISEGSPFLFGIKQNQVILSPDWICWKRYPLPIYYDDNNNPVVDTLGSSNNDLPLFGIELKYGIDGINFPSFFSERLTVSAIWQNVKLGVILPSDGWAKFGKDVLDITRKLTYAGPGIAGSFDFPIKVIPKSGVFHFDFGYVIGDAKESKYKNRKIDPLNYNPNLTIEQKDFDYLIRANLQGYYTFGLRIDDDYYFRIGLGGTFYQVEKWYNDLDTTTTGDIKLKFKKFESEAQGDVSLKIDFMSTNISTPFGVSLQYFNAGLGGNIWMQVPIVEKLLYLRLDASGSFALFKDKPEPWENKAYIVPMARIIINF